MRVLNGSGGFCGGIDLGYHHRHRADVVGLLDQAGIIPGHADHRCATAHPAQHRNHIEGLGTEMGVLGVDPHKIGSGVEDRADDVRGGGRHAGAEDDFAAL